MKRGRFGLRWLAALGVVPMLGIAGGPTTALADQDAGTGALSGTVQFAPGAGVPLGSGCNPTQWSIGSAGGTISAKLPGQEYSGPITASGGGGSTCAFATEEGGTLSIGAQALTEGVVPGSFSCSVGGQYLRVATHVLVFVQGTCSIANNTASGVWFLANAEFVPAVPQTSNGLQVQTAAFAAQFVIYPQSI